MLVIVLRNLYISPCDRKAHANVSFEKIYTQHIYIIHLVVDKVKPSYEVKLAKFD